MKIFIYIILILCSLRFLFGSMPHWILWNYDVSVSVNKGSCAIKIVPVLLNIIPIKIDEWTDENLSYELVIENINDGVRADISCGGRFNMSIEEGSIQTASYRNTEIFNFHTLPGFLFLNQEVYVSCYDRFELNDNDKNYKHLNSFKFSCVGRKQSI